jgi:hypothetical protein
MSKYPVKRGERALREAKTEAVDVVRPADPFFSFRYSRTEISAAGGKARVNSRQLCLEDGKLTAETFEGDVDRAIYDRMVGDAQRYFLNQTTLFARSLSWFLPSSEDARSDRD